MSAKFAAVGFAVAVIFFLFGFLSGMLVFKQKIEQQNGKIFFVTTLLDLYCFKDDDFFKNITTTKRTPKLEKGKER